MPALQLAHLINAVKLPAAQPLHHEQRYVFQSMEAAQAELPASQQVHQYSVHYPADEGWPPAFFQSLPWLKRSLEDLAPTGDPRKLPLLADVLRLGAATAQADGATHLIYTNADIILSPAFYQNVLKRLEAAPQEALVINRRRIAPEAYLPYDATHYPRIVQERGLPHPGFDCFVFPVDWVPRMVLGTVGIGIPFVEATLFYNLLAWASRLHLLDNVHWTYHLGLEVLPKRNRSYYWHNRHQFFRVVRPALRPYWRAHKLPYAELPLPGRYLKWARNPALFTLMLAKVELRHALYGY